MRLSTLDAQGRYRYLKYYFPCSQYTKTFNSEQAPDIYDLFAMIAATIQKCLSTACWKSQALTLVFLC